MDQLTLITPTSDRPVAFNLCERWMRRALDRFDGEIQWIVADDGMEPVVCTLGQEHLCRPHTGNRKKSFLGNLQTAMEKVRYEKVLFIEDDDWYEANYLNQMSSWLDKADIVGEGQARYYYLPTRRYRLCSNTDHASLCQTGIRSELLPWMSSHIQKHQSTFIDVHLWKTGAKNKTKLLIPTSQLSVGIKGLPGTKGIGVGHRLENRGQHDKIGSVLQQWTSKEDADVYFEVIKEHEKNSTPVKCSRRPLRHALAILTYVPQSAHEDVRKRLPEAIRSLKASDYDSPVFIIDDGSDDEEHCEYLEALSRDYSVIRRNKNGGVCQAKNTCIRVLTEHGIDVGFIAEDDIEFQHQWHEPYLEAHATIDGIHHYSWAWDDDPSRRMRKKNCQIDGHNIVETTRLNGVLLTFTPEVVRSVGGFKELPGKWGHTHTNWTKRIIRAGLAPFYADVVDSNNYITINQFGDQSSINDVEKRKLRKVNDAPSQNIDQVYFPIIEESDQKIATRQLEIGPGRKTLDGFEGFDISRRPGVQHVGKWGYERLPFDDNSFNVVYASHVLEHIFYLRVQSALEELFRILKVGGVAEIWVPDVEKVIARYQDGTITEDGWFPNNPGKDPWISMNGRLIWGGRKREVEHPQHMHRSLFDELGLKSCLQKAGFSEITSLSKPRGPGHGWIDLGVKGVRR